MVTVETTEILNTFLYFISILTSEELRNMRKIIILKKFSSAILNYVFA